MVMKISGRAVKGWLAIISEIPFVIENLQLQRVIFFLDKQCLQKVTVTLVLHFHQFHPNLMTPFYGSFLIVFGHFCPKEIFPKESDSVTHNPTRPQHHGSIQRKVLHRMDSRMEGQTQIHKTLWTTAVIWLTLLFGSLKKR